jgi:hypothetical protein
MGGPLTMQITRQERSERWFEMATGTVLAVVAVATAWSGYQAARWGGVLSERYSQCEAGRINPRVDAGRPAHPVRS